MILNHKKALDYILENRKDFKNLNLRKIEEVHGLLVDELSVAKGLRKKPSALPAQDTGSWTMNIR